MSKRGYYSGCIKLWMHMSKHGTQRDTNTHCHASCPMVTHPNCEDKVCKKKNYKVHHYSTYKRQLLIRSYSKTEITSHESCNHK